MRDDFVRIVKTLRASFPSVQPYFGPVPIYPSGMLELDVTPADAIDARRAARRAPRADRSGCRYYNRDIHRAAFAQPNYVRKLRLSRQPRATTVTGVTLPRRHVLARTWTPEPERDRARERHAA